MMSKNSNIRPEMIIFKEICSKLSKESGQRFSKVVLLVLQTEYGKRVSQCTLEEIGYLFDTTRERIRQIQEEAIGKRGSNGVVLKKGKLLSPEFQKLFKQLRE